MSTTYKKFNQICRVCLQEDALMFPLFGKNNVNSDISAMFMTCTSLKVSLGDGMPDLLCSTCLQKLETAYSFQQDAMQSDKKLRNILNENLEMTDPKVQVCTIKTEVTDSLSDNESDEFDETELNSFVKVEVEAFKEENNDTTIIEQPKEKKNERRLATIKPIAKKKRKVAKVIVSPRRLLYKCKKCNKSFERHKKFWIHKQVHPFYTCYVCWEEFDSKEGWEEHEKSHSTEIYVCSENSCDMQFNSFKLFIAHKKDDHNVTNYLHCIKCEKGFSTHEQWDIHIRKHIRQESFKCPHCPKLFAGQNRLDNHMKTHSTKFKCPHCQAAFPDRKKLRAHERSHSDAQLTCTECDRKFAQSSNLVRHVNTVHKGMKYPKREKKHLCTLCGQIFARPNDLTIHTRLHTGVKPFSCDKCEYKCHDKHLLKSHERKHSGIKPYKCSYCEKSFGTRSYLTIHERFHSGYRPYICSKCNKGFTNSKDLKVHERTHTGVKLFQCTTCHNSFTTLHYLRVHMKKHETQ